MGLFDKLGDDFKKSFTSGKAVTAPFSASSKQFKQGLRINQPAIDLVRGKSSGKKFLGQQEQATRIFAKTSITEGVIAGAAAPLGAFSQLFQKPDRDRPPGVEPGPGQGAGQEEAKRRARAQAISGARQRFGVRQTFATSPLGVVGGGATLGRKRLLGE